MDYRERLTIDLEVRVGKPGIRGMSTTVYDILASLVLAADFERRFVAESSL